MSPPPGGAGTRSGTVFQTIVQPALERNGYQISRQSIVGKGLGGGSHRLDYLALTPSGEKLVISLKWQEVSGTADEKIPFEVIKLLELVEQDPSFARAYIILGGDGMRPRLRKYYTDGSLARWIIDSDKVRCLTLNQFIKACNRQAL